MIPGSSIMAKSAKRQTADSIAAAAEPSPKSQPATMTQRDVARRSYELYLARGCEHGHDVDDWLQAERELHTDPEC